MVRAEQTAGLNVLGLLDYGPPHRTWGGEDDKYVPSPPSERVLTQWRSFVRSAAEALGDEIDYWEVWNEPNLSQFWKPAPNVNDYLTFLRAAREELRRADPGAQVVLGGASRVHVASDPPYTIISAADWLEQIYQAGGGDAFDVVAIHPYNSRPENVAADVRDIAAIVARHPENGSKPIWLTEAGWGLTDLRSRANERGTTAQQVQSDYLIRTYVLSIAIPGVERIFWHALAYGADGDYGLLDGSRPRPAFDGLRVTSQLLGDARLQRQVRGPDIDSGNGLGDDVWEFRFADDDGHTIAVLWKSEGGDEPRQVQLTDIDMPSVRIIAPSFRGVDPFSDGEVRQVEGNSVTVALTESPLFVLFEPGGAEKPPLDAAMAGGPVYDVVLPGETARMELITRNTGLIPWKADQGYLLKAVDTLPPGATIELPLDRSVPPDETAIWLLRIPAAGKWGVRRYHYQLRHQGDGFGPLIAVCVIELPEEAAELEAKIRQQIEEWRQQGEQEFENLIAQLEEWLRREIERQVETFIQRLLRQCSGSVGLLLVSMLLAGRQWAGFCSQRDRGGEGRHEQA